MNAYAAAKDLLDARGVAPSIRAHRCGARSMTYTLLNLVFLGVVALVGDRGRARPALAGLAGRRARRALLLMTLTADLRQRHHRHGARRLRRPPHQRNPYRRRPDRGLRLYARGSRAAARAVGAAAEAASARRRPGRIGRVTTLAQLSLSSRPLSWINTAFPFAAAYLLTTRELDARARRRHDLLPDPLQPRDVRHQRRLRLRDLTCATRARAASRARCSTCRIHRTTLIAALVTNVPFLVVSRRGREPAVVARARDQHLRGHRVFGEGAALQGEALPRLPHLEHPLREPGRVRPRARGGRPSRRAVAHPRRLLPVGHREPRLRGGAGRHRRPRGRHRLDRHRHRRASHHAVSP